MKLGALVIGVLYGISLTARAEIPPMTVNDFLLDAKTSEGKIITLSGFSACVYQNASLCMLYDDRMNFMKYVNYDASKMARRIRSALMSCSTIAPCRVVVKGTVVNYPLIVLNVTSLVVDNVSPSQAGDGERPSVAQTATMGVKDFILDGSQLKGRTVTVNGAAECDGTSCLLKERERTSQHVIRFEGSDLSRDDRERLLSCSGTFNEGCSAEVTGVVLYELRHVYLRASAIIWR